MKENVPYASLLNEAVEKPGILSACYSRFHNYSLGNQIWLYSQITARNEALAPVNTYKRWAALNRQVRKGEKSLTIAMPIVMKDKTNPDNSYTAFMLKSCLFTLDQTDGEPFKEETLQAQWDAVSALATLKVTQTPFVSLNGNVQGYAKKQSIAVSPIAALPHKTRFHELAHVVLGHTKDEDFEDGEDLTRAVQEVEAESVAYILCSILELPGLEESRGYIQHWLKDGQLQDKTCQRIFSAANKILKAGQPQKAEESQETLQNS